MPSLVSELSPSQRMWLAETFGAPDSGEFNPLQTADSSEVTPFQDGSERRVVSDATALSLSHGERSGAQYSPPQPAYTYFTLPSAPDLQNHQPSPTGLCENFGRSAIFRRTPAGLPDQGDAADLHPRPWTPPDRDRDYSSYYPPHQSPLPHHHYDATSRNFAILRPASFRSNGRVEIPTNLKRPNPTSSSHQTPKYPHGGDKLTWQQSYENLRVYKETYGDCDVPQKYKHNIKLGGWVNKQRKKKKNPSKYGKLTELQISLMESLGFKWNVEQSG